MFEIHREELDWAGRKLTLETGRVARQADGAVWATYGETTVLATVVSAQAPKPGSPGCGTEWKVQTSLPVRASQARVSPRSRGRISSRSP